MKICKRCKRSKPPSAYGKTRDRFRHSPHTCLACKKQIAEAKQKRRKMAASGKSMCAACGVVFSVTSTCKSYCKPCAAAYVAKWRAKNIEKARAISRKASKKHRFSSINVTIRLRMIGRMYAALDRTLRREHRARHGGTPEAMKNWIGCTPEQLRRYLELQFTDGMRWDNFGQWHIDHVIPLCRFDAKSEADMKEAWHYTNLRPLWAKQNLSRPSKHGRVIHQPMLMIV